MGIAPLLAKGFDKLATGSSVSRLDLEREKGKQLKIKHQLITELDNINKQINTYEQNIRGWNGQQTSNNGVAGFDRLTQAPASKDFR